jgi:hypothetical protein
MAYTRDGWLRGYRVLFKNWVAILSLFICHPKQDQLAGGQSMGRIIFMTHSKVLA